MNDPAARPHALKLQVSVLTPEGSVYDGPAEHVVVPAHDGEVAFYSGHAPFVGAVGVGELRIVLLTAEVRRFYLEGGVAMVADNVVTVLAERVVPTAKLEADKAEAELQAALATVPTTDEAFADRERKMDAARAKITVARRTER